MSDYRGRFAPSPTGPLHFGSLLAALAGYLDARANKGLWFLRIEDLDPPREDPAAADAILRILDAYGLHWDGSVLYQSQRHAAYEGALSNLIANKYAFPCACSRRQLGEQRHQGICKPPSGHDFAWRFLCPTGQLVIKDGLQNDHQYDLKEDIGDFVIRRRDHLWSYQLAVVVDDADSEITHIVRGIDLLDSTVRQRLIQNALGLPEPVYSHIPIAIEADGHKLSKQNLALPLQASQAGDTLWTALHWLKQSVPIELKGADCQTILEWGILNWHPQHLKGITAMPAPTSFCRSA